MRRSATYRPAWMVAVGEGARVGVVVGGTGVGEKAAWVVAVTV